MVRRHVRIFDTKRQVAMDAVGSMAQTFRLRKSVLYQGIACTGLFLCAVAWVVYGCVSSLSNPAQNGFKDRESVMIVGGMGVVVFGSMLLLSLYVWAAYYVEHLTINGTLLSIRSMLQNCQVDVTELTCLKWRVAPIGGRIDFRLLAGKARVDLGGYSDGDRLRIVRALRELVPPPVQEGWPLFCYRIALPLRDGNRPQGKRARIRRIESTAEFCVVSRRRYDVMLAVALPLSLTVAIVVWKWLDLWQFISLPFLILAAWLLLRLHVPAEGCEQVRVTSTTSGLTQLFTWSAIAVGQLVAIALILVGCDKSIAQDAMLAIMLAILPVAFYGCWKVDRQRRKAEEEGVTSAPNDWDQAEGLER